MHEKEDSPPPPPPPPEDDSFGAPPLPEDSDGDDFEGCDQPLGAMERAPKRAKTKSAHLLAQLATVSRQHLDFDQPPVCRVTLSPHAVYCCLTCGAFLKGRVAGTPAMDHAGESGHSVFMRLDGAEGGRMPVYVLPDGEEIDDKSLGDVRAAAWPTYTREKMAALDTAEIKRVSLAGEPYIPGAVGLRVAINHTDYANSVVQALVRVGPLRDHFLLERAPGKSLASLGGDRLSASSSSASSSSSSSSSTSASTSASENDRKKGSSGQSGTSSSSSSHAALVRTFGDLVARVWSPDNFRSHVGPGPFLEAVAAASDRKFGFGAAGADPAEFLAWLLRALRKGGKSISHTLDRCFKGKVTVTSKRLKRSGDGDTDGHDASKNGEAGDDVTVTTNPFVMLSIDVPPAPLFKDAAKGSVIPQVPIYTCLAKFDGQTETYSAEQGVSRTYRIAQLPQFLIVHLRRLSKNEFFVEKNPTIVTFPCEGLDLSEHFEGPGEASRYNLLASIVHEGTPKDGSYHAHVRHKGTKSFFSIQDLIVEPIIPQLIGISEAHILIFEREGK